MNNLKGLKDHFLKLLYYYRNNYDVSEKKCFLEFISSVNSFHGSAFPFKRALFYINQNINSRLMVMVDPYFLYGFFKAEDKIKIDNLFLKILQSINLKLDNIYLTFSEKNIIHSNDSGNLNKQKEFFNQELDLVKPDNILIFGKYGLRLFKDKLDIKCNDISKSYKDKNMNIYYTNNPVEVFYNTDLKKNVWQYLKYARNECNF